jgi:hypothetical protein
VPDSNEKSFGFPSDYRGLIIFLLIGCCGFIAFFIVVALAEQDRESLVAALGGVTLFGTGAVYVAQGLTRVRDRISVDDEAISYLSQRGPATVIAWNEIGEVEAHDFWRRLVVSDLNGRRKIKLEYQLEDFDTLREIVLKRTAERRNQTPAETEFRRNYANRGFFLLVFLAFAAIGVVVMRKASPVRGMAFFAFAALPLFALKREPSKVRILPDSFIVNYLGWHRRVPISEVKNIELVRLHGRDVSAPVIIECIAGKPVTLTGFLGGSVALWDALRRAWQASPNRSAAPLAASASLHTPGAAAAFSAAPARPASFHPGPRIRLILWLPFLLVLVYGAMLLFQDEPLAQRRIYALLAYLAIVVGCQAYLFAKLPLRITLTEDDAIVQYLWFRRILPFRAIASVELRRPLIEQAKAAETVAVQLKDGRTFRLGNFRSHHTTLYEALDAACKYES